MNRKDVLHHTAVVWVASWIDLVDVLSVILTFGIYKGFNLGLRFRAWCIKRNIAASAPREEKDCRE